MGNLSKFDLFLRSEKMQPSYLDRFDLRNQGLPKVSAIVPTYNRCPHTPQEDSNPLGWCLESLLAQKGEVLGEIIVMDDASADYTEEVVRDFQSKAPVDIRYFRNKKNLGSSINRNKAVALSNFSNVLFLDDDCIFSNYFAFGAAYTLGKLPSTASALHMPVYHRKIKPSPGRLEDIGVLDLQTGLMTGNYDTLPEAYPNNPGGIFLNREMGILKPLEIRNLGGVFIAKKGDFQAMGGFPSFLSWKNGYREETNVAIELAKMGKRIFFTPDPKFHSVHLKYGAMGTEEESNVQDPKLKRLISQSSVGREDTGNRVDPEEWFFDRIISTFVTLGRQNKKAANNYMERMSTEFVDQNELAMTGVGHKINERERRRRIFLMAKREGRRLMRAAV